SERGFVIELARRRIPIEVMDQDDRGAPCALEVLHVLRRVAPQLPAATARRVAGLDGDTSSRRSIDDATNKDAHRGAVRLVLADDPDRDHSSDRPNTYSASVPSSFR